jgi:hypothetical protein
VAHGAEERRSFDMRQKEKKQLRTGKKADGGGCANGPSGPASFLSPGGRRPRLALSSRSAKRVRWFVFLLLATVALAGFFLRFYHLQADPPLWGYVYDTDEGHYSYTAHNRLVFGHWFVNEARYGLITPLFTFIQYLVAVLGGGDPSIASYRLVSAVCGVFSCGLMALFFQDRWRALVAVTLASASFMGFVHSRLGITEMMLTLMIQITVLAAWQAFKRASFLLAALSGAAAAGSVMVKPTAAFIAPIILIAPLLCRIPVGGRRSYWLGTAAGGVLAALLWSLIVVLPYWDAWRHMMAHSTSFGRASISLDFATAECLWHFLLSPALQTMPFLWPLALCWCFVSWVPRWWRRENDILDTLLFLWIAAGVGLLGIPAYQPARWQIMLFPPVMCAGLKFLPNLQRTSMAVMGLVAAAGVAALYSCCTAGHFLADSAEIEPVNGVFGHFGPALTALSLFVAAWFVARAFSLEKWQRLACGIITVELAMQCWFHAKYTWPTFLRPSQWDAVARDLEHMPSRETAVFSGEMVQDLSLRAKIRVLPIYYLLEEPTDAAVRDFFARQNCVPTFFVLMDSNLKQWFTQAPVFASSLEEVGSYPLLIGGIGWQNVHFFRFRSYEWLATPGQPESAPGAPQEKTGSKSSN